MIAYTRCFRLFVLALIFSRAVLFEASCFAKGVAEHVVVVVFDGMRPDYITPQFCPILYALATNGVFFKRNNCAYISSTIVNGTVLATGTNPGRNGILANSDYREELGFTTSIASESLDTVRRGDIASGGKYIAVDTVAELIQDAGFRTVVAGTKGVALMQDRSIRRTDSEAHRSSITLARGLVLPRGALDALNKVNDDRAFPDTFTVPNVASDSWTTKALTRGLWRNGVPKYSLLWLSDPDVSQHANGPGSTQALSAIESSDKNLGEVIKYLKEKGVYEKTDLFVVSDHGFSTIAKSVDIAAALRVAKFHAHSKIENPERGDVMVVGLGGSALIYVVEREESVIREVVNFLQSCDFSGVIFSRLKIEGTFSLDSVGYTDEKHAPDVILAMRWMPERSDLGAPGMLIATGGNRNAGTHGSLSRYDMNNTLVVSGPDFKRGHISEVPSGNVDVVPTVLDILGIEPVGTIDGRVLTEGMVKTGTTSPVVVEDRLEARRQSGFMNWSQYLKVARVGNTRYFTEGNGEVTVR